MILPYMYTLMDKYLWYKYSQLSIIRYNDGEEGHG
jgi:hypothetical protein